MECVEGTSIKNVQCNYSDILISAFNDQDNTDRTRNNDLYYSIVLAIGVAFFVFTVTTKL